MTAALVVNPLAGPQRLALLAGLGAATLACWVYLALMMRDMSAMAAMPGAMAVEPLRPSYIAGLFVMWTVMQAAMMLPSAVPMTYAYARMRAGGAERARLFGPVALFVVGYVCAWSAFSLAAALLQAGLTAGALVSPMAMKLAGEPAVGAVLIAAGVYQWLPWKHACLRHCRTPIGFLMTEWHDGRLGPVTMGWQHGLFCVGCCWAVMCLLFAGGVMNPVWIVAIAVYVLLEKVVPHGAAVTRLAGLALIGGGFWLVAA
jgi:predicted metal-binding membrane protein